MPDYQPPEFEKDAFNCPHCEAFSNQMWRDLKYIKKTNRKKVYNSKVAICSRCDEKSIWLNGEMVYPYGSPAPLPNDDMPEDVKKHYEEAREVVRSSPRAASALLRLSIEELAAQLNHNRDQSLYQNIGDLLDEGIIDERIQEALDSVRVYGNDHVHAGEIVTDDSKETALRLFELVNIIVDTTISQEKLIKDIYSGIPENKKKGVKSRDGGE